MAIVDRCGALNLRYVSHWDDAALLSGTSRAHSPFLRTAAAAAEPSSSRSRRTCGAAGAGADNASPPPTTTINHRPVPPRRRPGVNRSIFLCFLYRKCMYHLRPNKRPSDYLSTGPSRPFNHPQPDHALTEHRGGSTPWMASFPRRPPPPRRRPLHPLRLGPTGRPAHRPSPNHRPRATKTSSLRRPWTQPGQQPDHHHAHRHRRRFQWRSGSGGLRPPCRRRLRTRLHPQAAARPRTPDPGAPRPPPGGHAQLPRHRERRQLPPLRPPAASGTRP